MFNKNSCIPGSLFSCLLVTILLLVLARISVTAQTMCMKHFTINDGLAGSHVYMCHQDKKGYLWIATTSGLSRFDGKKFRNYDFEDGLLDNEVLFVTSGHNNEIWLNTFSRYPSFSLITADHIRNYSNIFGLSPVSNGGYLTAGIYSARNKVTYLVGANSYVCIKNEREYLMKNMARFVGSPPFETENGNIYIGDTQNLYTLKDTVIKHALALESNERANSYYYYKGILYKVMSRAVVYYRLDGGRFVREGSISFEKNINLFYPDQYGTWITFANQEGAILYDDHFFRSNPRAVNVPSIINFFTDDREGNVWICTIDNGLFCLPDPAVVNYTVSDGLLYSSVSAVVPVSADSCWLGYSTGEAQLVILKDGKLYVKEHLKMGHNRAGNAVLDIVTSSRNQIYFLTRDAVYKWADKRLTAIFARSSGKSLISVNDTLLGVGGWVYAIINNKSGKIFDYLLGRIYAQVTDGQNLWLGGLNGLYRLAVKDHARTDISPLQIIRDIRINALAVYGSYVWAGTHNNGMYLIHNDSVVGWYTAKTNSAILSNTIKALVIKNNELWIGTNRGVSCCRFDYDKRQFVYTVKADYYDGLLSPEVNEIKTFDSNIFIATYGGLTILTKLRPRKLDYKVSDFFVTDVQKGTVLNGDTARLYYSSRGFEIGFNTTSFKYSSEISYQYRLEAFDNEWKHTKNNLVAYTNIPPGNYRFFVKAYDSRGNSSKDLDSIYIIVQPLYWQTLWFRIAILLLAIAIISFAFYLFYRYNVSRTNYRLEQGKLIAKSKLTALRAQLKPHFIYNSLNAIKDFIYNNKNDDAAELLQGFAGLIRKGFHLSDQDFVSLKEEIEFINRYLELEQKKCEHCFDFKIAAPEEIKDFIIPSLVTQPFVENAVIHGIRGHKNVRGFIQITYMLQGNDIVITIADNGIGIRRSTELKKLYHSYSRGMSISRERIEYFKIALGIDIHLSVLDKTEEDPAISGTVVIIKIINAIRDIAYEK